MVPRATRAARATWVRSTTHPPCPRFIGPLARLYFLTATRMSREERERRAGLFGGLRDGFRPNKPYQWRLGEGRSLVEIPVTTIPLCRVPFHMSYLLYLSRFSHRLMLAYLRSALLACRLSRVQPSFLLHPLDLLGGDQAPGLSFFPEWTFRCREATGVRRSARYSREASIDSLLGNTSAIHATGLPERVPAFAMAIEGDGMAEDHKPRGWRLMPSVRLEGPW